jgi:hypothetical protein
LNIAILMNSSEKHQPAKPGLLNEPIMDFKSADPSVVKSIRQRDLLNTWLRLYARRQCLPCRRAYQPDRFAEESSDLVHYTVESRGPSARFVIERLGSSMRQAYGSLGDGQDLAAFLGPRLAPVVMPIYLECARRARPVYSIMTMTDVRGRIVDHERLLLPFSEQTGEISHVIASQKTISEDGDFAIRNLMRANGALPKPVLLAVIDRNLFHSLPARGSGGGVVQLDWD